MRLINYQQIHSNTKPVFYIAPQNCLPFNGGPVVPLSVQSYEREGPEGNDEL